MKTLLFILLAMLPVEAGVSVCVTYGTTKTGTAVSGVSEINCLDASGMATSFHYGRLTTDGDHSIDGGLVFQGKVYYIGKTGTDNLLLYYSTLK